MPNTLVLIYGAIFLGVVLLAEAAFLLFRDAKRKSNRATNQRLRMQASGLSSKETLLKLRKDDIGVPAGNLRDRPSPLLQPIASLTQLLRECGVVVPASRIIMIMVGLAAVLWVMMILLSPVHPVASLPMALIMGFGIPVMLLIRKKRLRINKFAEQLPDALDMMVRSLKAGHPIRSAMTLVSKEMSDPMGSEVGIVVDEMTYGLELREALENWRERIDLIDLQYMIVTINIQYGTGGNLGEVLSNLSKVIRDRFRLYKKVDALSAEGRLAAVIVGLIPFVIGVGMTLINPAYYIEAMEHTAFFVVAVIALVLYLGSMFVIYRIIHIRV
jgi:tight adherence protein B